MRKFAFPALLTLLLLAVAAPNCLAAGNSASDQQPASQYSKLPPLQLSGSPLAQKEYFQAALWLAQQESRQASPPRVEDEWMGLNTTKATVLSSLAALLTAIMAPVISIFVARKSMDQAKKSLEDDFNQRKLEQKENFKFQLYQLALEEKKRVMLNFFESTSISALYQVDFRMDKIRIQLTLLEMLMNRDFYDKFHFLFTFLNQHTYDFFQRAPSDPINQNVISDYKLLHLGLANEIRRVLSGAEFDPTLTASK